MAVMEGDQAPACLVCGNPCGVGKHGDWRKTCSDDCYKAYRSEFRRTQLLGWQAEIEAGTRVRPKRGSRKKQASELDQALNGEVPGEQELFEAGLRALRWFLTSPDASSNERLNATRMAMLFRPQQREVDGSVAKEAVDKLLRDVFADTPLAVQAETAAESAVGVSAS